VHTMNQTKAAFRLLIKREERRQYDLCEEPTTPYTYHVVASKWPVEEKTAHEGFIWHKQRGQAENFNKELKQGLGLEELPCGDSGVKAVFFRIGVLAITSSLVSNAWPVPPQGRRRRSRRFAGVWCRWPGGFCAMPGG